jgi:plasmid stabilization system protein ParE
MNERIRELAEQAGFYFYDMHDVNGEDLGETIEADSWNAAEKFAELIVQECASLCEVTAAGRDAEDIAQAILAHFGVKE